MYTEEQMIAIGGRVWDSPDGEKHRVYLNWQDLVGFQVEHYKSGNIRYAEVGGETISNTFANDLLEVTIFWEGGRLRAQQPSGGWDGLNGKSKACRYVMDKVTEVIDARLCEQEETFEVVYEMTLAIKGGPVPSEEDIAIALTKELGRSFSVEGVLIARL